MLYQQKDVVVESHRLRLT